MKKSLSTAVALSAACALAGSMANPAHAATHLAHQASKPSAITAFGYKANAVGTKVVVDNVELSTIKDAYAQQKCTRVVGKNTEVGSIASNANGGILPIPNSLIKVSPSLSETHTYSKDGVNGVQAISTIASINLGGTVAGIQTPTLSIKGLQSFADSYNKAGKFGATSSFKYKGLALQLPQGNPVSDSLQTLFDALGVDPSQINDVIAVPVNTLVTTLTGLTNNLLTIPGLGTVKLGKLTKTVGQHSAEATTYALQIRVDDPTDNHEKTQLQLGVADARITDGVPSGVFRSSMTALDLHLGDLLSFGSVRERSLPCEGTFGKTVVNKVHTASVLGGQLVNLSAIRYAYSGKQLKNGGASGFVSTTIGRAEVPAIGLVVKGLSSRVDLVSHGAGKKVTRKVTSSVASITINGQSVAVPAPGQTSDLPNGLGVLAFQTVRHDDFYGTEVSALTLTLFQNNSIIDLGKSAGRIWFK